MIGFSLSVIAAHEALEGESENFWLTQWLRKQLAELRVRLETTKASGGTL